MIIQAAKRLWVARVLGCFVAVALASACGEDTKTVTREITVEVEGPSVSVEGGVIVEIGKTIALAATTVGGTDTAYTWSSANEAVARVDDTGLVTGVAAGECIITATGVDTASWGSHGVAVMGAALEVPFVDLWSASGHNKSTDEVFRHWDEDGEIPVDCARCHSAAGFQDYIGADGSAVGSVEQAAPVGETITCITCHNAAAIALSSVTFPSGNTISDLGAEARCMTCHQGRESNEDVNAAILAVADGGVNPDRVSTAEVDTIDGENRALRFLNIHYFAAGATRYGRLAAGGAQFPGAFYDAKFTHVSSVNDCVTCHSPHTLEVQLSTCATCHAGVASLADVTNIRMAGSINDYDGDGNVAEGIHDEVEGLKAALLATMQAYATAVSGADPIAYADAYPYFFVDDDGDGLIQEAETTRYATFTPNLLRAAYNYQLATKDPGAFAHNAKYVIQLLYDSIAALEAYPDVTVSNFGSMRRSDGGHFNGEAEAWRHWDDEGAVNAACARCHSPTTEAFGFYITNRVDPATDAPITDGMSCETCHVGSGFAENPPRRYVDVVEFPSGVEIVNDPDDVDDSFLCMSCHQGRISKADIDVATSDWEVCAALSENDCAAGPRCVWDPDAQSCSGALRFMNVHYLAAGASIYASVAQVGYEYAGQAYGGPFTHFGEQPARCTYCHEITASRHSYQVSITRPLEGANNGCKTCHDEITGDDVETIRKDAIDYDDNPATTALVDEVDAFASRLLEQMQNIDPALVYDGDNYPYFVDGDTGDAFANWTPQLLKAAHNYQFSRKEHGAWAHNHRYILQLLYDSLVDLDGDVSQLTRPVVE